MSGTSGFEEYVEPMSVPVQIVPPREPRREGRKRARREAQARREQDLASSSDDAPPRKVRLRRRKARVKIIQPYNYLADAHRRQTIRNRRLFRRTCEGFVECVVPKLTDYQYKMTFRMTRNTMSQLQEHFQTGVKAENMVPVDMRANVPLSHYMLMFLWFVGNGRSFETLSEVFDVDIDETMYVIDTVIRFFRRFESKVSPYPRSWGESKRNAEAFRKAYQFPGIVGCITCQYLRIRAPPPSALRFWTTIQTIYDYKGRIIDVHTNSTTKLHPQNMLQESPIWSKLPETCYRRYHFIGDESYYVRDWLLTPFERAESRNEVLFNIRHSAIMECAHRAWEQIKERFTQLTSVLLTPDYIDDIVVACIILQNICLDERDYFDDDDEASEPGVDHPVYTMDSTEIIQDDPDLRSLGLLKRRQISHDMMEIDEGVL